MTSPWRYSLWTWKINNEINTFIYINWVPERVVMAWQWSLGGYSSSAKLPKKQGFLHPSWLLFHAFCTVLPPVGLQPLKLSVAYGHLSPTWPSHLVLFNAFPCCPEPPIMHEAMSKQGQWPLWWCDPDLIPHLSLPHPSCSDSTVYSRYFSVCIICFLISCLCLECPFYLHWCWLTFAVNGKMVKIWGFAGHTVSVATTHLS